MAANTNTEREAFEAHFKKPPFEFEMDRFNSDGAWPGSYVIYYVQCAWEAWQARASLSLPAAGQEPVAKLWLWKNFVNGRPEYWAFDNPFPCVSVGGDPLTFGEPCGWALLKPSVNGRPDRSEQEVTNTVVRLAAARQPAAPYSIDADPQGIRATVADAITGALAFGAQGVNKPPEGHWLAPFWNAARADKTAPQPAVAAGWVRVPTDPTLDMGWAYLDAARESEPFKTLSFNHDGYRAMLKAAPLPPAPSTEGERNG